MTLFWLITLFLFGLPFKSFGQPITSPSPVHFREKRHKNPLKSSVPKGHPNCQSSIKQGVPGAFAGNSCPGDTRKSRGKTLYMGTWFMSLLNVACFCNSIGFCNFTKGERSEQEIPIFTLLYSSVVFYGGRGASAIRSLSRTLLQATSTLSKFWGRECPAACICFSRLPFRRRLQ
jgi:hypothetical protein